MAARRRVTARPLIEELLANPQRFDLVQAMAILERHAGAVVPLGVGMDPELEGLRIEQDAGLAFPASDVSAVSRGRDGRPVLRQPVIGVAGLGGPLPQAFTEAMLERLHRRDPTMAAFLDIFNHRLASIFYRIRRSTLPLLNASPEGSSIASALRSFVGLGTPGLPGRLPDVPDRMVLGFAGIFADRRRSAASLETVLSGTFRVPVKVRSFEGRWLRLEPRERTALGRGGRDESRRLGGGAVLGSRVWDQHAAYVVQFSFDALPAFLDALPSGRHHRTIASMCRFHSDGVAEPVMEMRLAAKAVPELKVSTREGQRLGWTSWLIGKGRKAKADGTVRISLAPAAR